MRKAVFLDRDGTINVDKNYLYRIEDFEFLPGAVEGLRMLGWAGFLPVIVTNQSGIARGYFSEEDCQRLHGWLASELEGLAIAIGGIYCCPHHPDAKVERYRIDCGCRKPKRGLFERAARELGIDMERSFAVGDRERDVAVCSESPLRGVVLYCREASVKGRIWRITGGLREAAEMILGMEKVER